jgi:succinylglutamate desuccinylase
MKIKKTKDQIIIKGKNKGNRSVVFVGVHGNEICGPKSLERILPSLQIENGEVCLVYANPKALEKNVRFTESNLNRMFKNENKISKEDKKSYEYKRAKELKKILIKYDVLLDVHASYVPESKPFFICEKNAEVITDYINIPTVVYGFDAIEPGGTDGYMNSIGKIGICVECGYMTDEEAVNIAEKAILEFLLIRGHVKKESDIKKVEQNKIQMYLKYYAKTDSFKLSKNFKDFEVIEKGQIIGIVSGKEVIADRKSIILFASNTNKVGAEVFLLGEEIKV